MLQNTASPTNIFLPNSVSINSIEDVKQSKPIRKTINPIKNVWIVIIWRLTKLNNLSSLSQLKYFGKMTCIKANTTKSIPIIFKWTCILIKNYGQQVKIDIKGVNLVSWKEENLAPSKAFLQAWREKKCVKPTEKAKKFGKSRKCSTIITLPLGLQSR